MPSVVLLTSERKGFVHFIVPPPSSLVRLGRRRLLLQPPLQPPSPSPRISPLYLNPSSADLQKLLDLSWCAVGWCNAKGVPKCHWGSRMLKRLVEARSGRRSKRKRVSPGQQQLPFAFDVRLNQIPEEWHQVAVRCRRANGIRDGDRERRFWQLR